MRADRGDRNLARSEVLRSVTEARRTIHRHAELGHQEWRTADFLSERLGALERYHVFRPAPTSVAALSAGSRAGLIIIRADIDALPLTEQTGVSYASPENMHACGHDGHAAALLVAAELWPSLAPASAPGVLFVFQQAEEAHPSGGSMVVRGLRERLGTTLAGVTCYGMHLWPELPAATVGVRAGPVMASVAGLTLRITGRAGATHGSRAQADGTDALAASMLLYRELKPLLHRRDLAGGQQAALHIGQFEAGERPQDTALRAELRGTLRALSHDAEQAAISRIEEIATAVSAESGVTCTVQVETGIRPPLINDEAPVREVTAACQATGTRCVSYPASPLGVSEDFGCYRELGPSAFFWLGCADDQHRHNLHDPRFNFDESVLVTGIEVLIALMRRGTVTRSGESSSHAG
jgi:amidohydrolase